MIRAGLTIREDFADVVNQLMYHVDVPGLPLLHYQGSTNDLGDGRDV
jgi:hypothetical protein